MVRVRMVMVVIVDGVDDGGGQDCGNNDGDEK